ncbi:MAG: hypothetical protein DRJ62_01450 [Thermoprotei archaeon]|nr:MAG: hypothetical protein DRJ62_01450 [Thermoprotei archaeon]
MPKLLLELPQSLYEKLRREALERGLTVEAYLKTLLERLVGGEGLKRGGEARGLRAKSRIPDGFYEAFKRWWRARGQVSFEEFVEQAVKEGYSVGDVYTWSYRLWTKFEEQEEKSALKLLERVKASKILMLSELKPRNPKLLVELAKSAGVEVIEGARDLALVDREFYESFLKRLSEVPRDMKGLSLPEEKLLKFLWENGLVYLDVEGRWRLT